MAPARAPSVRFVATVGTSRVGDEVLDKALIALRRAFQQQWLAAVRGRSSHSARALLGEVDRVLMLANRPGLELPTSLVRALGALATVRATVAELEILRGWRWLAGEPISPILAELWQRLQKVLAQSGHGRVVRFAQAGAVRPQSLAKSVRGVSRDARTSLRRLPMVG